MLPCYHVNMLTCQYVNMFDAPCPLLPPQLDARTGVLGHPNCVAAADNTSSTIFLDVVRKSEESKKGAILNRFSFHASPSQLNLLEGITQEEVGAQGRTPVLFAPSPELMHPAPAPCMLLPLCPPAVSIGVSAVGCRACPACPCRPTQLEVAHTAPT